MRRIANCKIYKESGFTLVETMLAISIFVIMLTATVAFFVFLYKEQAADIARIESAETASSAIERIGREIRKMNRAENGTFPLELAQGQKLVFYSDVDNDGLTERVEYILNGIYLERRLIEPGSGLDYSGEEVMTVVASDVRNGSNSVFRYYDENYTGSEDSLSEPINVTEVKVIEISFDINTDEKYLSAPLHVETKVQPRNLRSFN